MKVAFVCPACRATISAPPSLEGESAPCPKCDAEVDRWPAPVNPPPTSPAAIRVVPPPLEQAVWHYSVNGARRGPVTATQLKSLVESAVLRANDLLWREGMPAWVEAGTIPGLFPALVPVPAPPAPAPPPPQSQPAEEDEDRPSRRDDRPIQVTVNQVIERDERDRRPRRRRGFRCPYCGSSVRPIFRQQVSSAGWAVFVVLLVFTIVFCFLGLLMTEEVRYCGDCGERI